MTAPGAVIAPQPGWWVRTNKIGTSEGTFGWSSVVSSTNAMGSASGGYGWSAIAASAQEFPYEFPYTLG